MAYFCLTQWNVRRRQNTCGPARYRIAKKLLLDTMGTITTKHGDCQSARKASAAQSVDSTRDAFIRLR